MKTPTCPAHLEVAALAINANPRFARGTFLSRTSSALLTLLTATFALVLTGCIPFAGAIPSISRPIIAGKRFTTGDVTFVQPGMTTRQDIIRELGQPWAFYEDSQVMVYYGEQRVGYWAAGLAPLAHAPAPMDGGEITRLHYLFVKLDHRDRVARIGFVKATHRTKTREVVKKWEADLARNSELGTSYDKSALGTTASAK